MKRSSSESESIEDKTGEDTKKTKTLEKSDNNKSKKTRTSGLLDSDDKNVKRVRS